MTKKKATKKVETGTTKRAPKIMTVDTIAGEQTETIEPTTQEVEGKTWIKTTTTRRSYDVK